MRSLYTAEGLERLRHLEEQVADSRVDLAACDAAVKLTILAETSPDVATKVGLGFEFEPRSVETDGASHSSFTWWWDCRAFGLALDWDPQVSREQVLGGLSVYVDQELVLAIDVHQTADDGFRQIHAGAVTAFTPGDWMGRVWELIEEINRSPFFGRR